MFVTEPHDTLHSLIQKQYGVFPYDQPLHGLLLKYLHLLNPEIFSVTQPLGARTPRSLNLISPNPKDLLCRDPDAIEKKIQQMMRPSGGFERINNVSNYVPEDKESRALFEMLLRASMAQDATTTLLGGGIGALGEIGSKSHLAALQKLSILRRQHANGAITRQQYNLAQKEVLRQFQNKLGFMEKLVYGSKGAHGALYQNRARGIEPTAKFENGVQRMVKLSKLVKIGGVLLTSFALRDGCQQIAETSDPKKKNEIAYQTIFTVIGGLLVSMVVITGPLGVGLATLAHTSAGFIAGVTSHMAGTFIYDKYGEKLDLADNEILGRLCSK